MNTTHPELQSLIDVVWRAVEVRRDKATGKQVEVPAVIPVKEPRAESRFSASFPVLSYLDDAVALAREFELYPVADSFEGLVHTLHWSQNPSYDEVNSDPSFLAGYAYAALSGPEGPIYCAVPRGGFMLMGPNVTYPDHRHAPEEIYLVMTPGAQWRLDQGDWFDVSPGDLIFHSTWQMHALRTRDQPLLTFSSWLEPGCRIDIESGG